MDCLHIGHRKRMVDKFLASPDSFPEHELLEVALFLALPRKNTNDLAHRLIKTFGSLEKVLSATSAQLQNVEGVGKHVAFNIVLYGKIAKKFSQKLARADNKIVYTTFEKTKEQIIARLKDYKKESFLIVLLDDRYTELSAVVYDDDRPYNVSAELTELVGAIAINKPKKMITTHNHNSGNCNPSIFDDVATLKIKLLCDMHGIELVDHVIVYEDTAYSYFQELRLDYIKRSSNLEELFKNKEKENEQG